MDQGKIAVKNGQDHESDVKKIIKSKIPEVREVQYRDYNKKPPKRKTCKKLEDYGSEVLILNSPYINTCGNRCRSELLLISKKCNIAARIECRSQQGRGSVDQKFDYLLRQFDRMPEKDIIVIIKGNGFQKGSVAQFKNDVVEKKYEDKGKMVHVFTEEEFSDWLSKKTKSSEGKVKDD